MKHIRHLTFVAIAIKGVWAWTNRGVQKVPVPIWVFRANRITRRELATIIVVGREKNNVLRKFLIKTFLTN